MLITVTIITLLVAGALEIHRKMRSTVFSTGTTRDRVTLSHMVSAGVNVAMAMLVKDKKESDIDSLQEDWADPEKIAEVLGDIRFENGNVTFTISDELGKIQINALVKFPKGRVFNTAQKLMWERFLRFIISLDDRFEEIEETTIINSMKDWLDSGDDDLITGLNGAESEYYQDLEPPYACRNGPMTHLDEIALVRGVTPELFHGASEMAGISDYLTIHGMTDTGGNTFTYGGKININTAPVSVVAAMLPPENEDLARVICDYRLETSDSQYIHEISSPTWYKNVPGCSDIEIDPGIITTASDIFRIASTAKLNEMKMTVAAVVKREKESKTGKWKCSVLRWVVK